MKYLTSICVFSHSILLIHFDILHTAKLSNTHLYTHPHKQHESLATSFCIFTHNTVRPLVENKDSQLFLWYSVERLVRKAASLLDE